MHIHIDEELGNKMLVKVSDNGSGIPEEMRAAFASLTLPLKPQNRPGLPYVKA